MPTLGRINRLTYWLALLAVAVINAILTRVIDKSAPALFVLIVIIAVPRLHDIGRTGWWALGTVAGEFLAGIAIALLLPEAIRLYALFGVMSVVAGLIILVGAWPGQALPNRFGPQPARGISYSKF